MYWYKIKMRNILITVLLFVVSVTQFLAQKITSPGNFIITNYESSVYKAHSQNWAIAQDSLGRMYFGNSNGLLTFDGSNWQTHTVANSSIVRSLKIVNSKIYVGAQNEFGYFEPDKTGKLTYFSLKQTLPDTLKQFNDVWSILVDSGTVYFSTLNYIFIYKDNKTNVLPTSSRSSFLNFFNQKAAIVLSDKGLVYINNNKFVPTNTTSFIKNDRYYIFMDLGNNSGICGSRQTGLNFFGSKKPIKVNEELSNFLNKSLIYNAIKLNNKYFAVGTLNGGIIILDYELNPVKLVNKSNGLIDNAIYAMFTDNTGNLWVGTENGISYIEINSPITYFSENQGVESLPFTMNAFDQNLYFSTQKGITRINTANNKPFGSNFHESVNSNSDTRFWNISKFEHTIFYAADDNLIINEKNKLTHLKFNFSIWQIDTIKQFKSRYWLFCADGIRVLSKENNKWLISKVFEEFKGNCRYADMDEEGNLWIAQNAVGITKLVPNQTATGFSEIVSYNKFKGIEIIEMARVLSFKNTVIASVNSNLFLFNNETKTFKHLLFNSVNSKNFYLLHADAFGNIFAQYNNRPAILTISGTMAEINVQVFSRLPETNVVVRLASDSNYTYIGYPKTIYLIEKHKQKNNLNEFKTILTSIVNISTDSVLYSSHYNYPEAKKSIFTSSQNSVRFNFSASNYFDLQNNQFSYKLHGFDKNWSHWSSTKSKDYTNLPPGDYLFQIRSKNSSDLQGKITEFKFTIKPPWYRTTIAYIVYFILLVLIFDSVLRLNTKRLKNKNRLLEEIVRNRTMEILDQKEQLKIHAIELENTNLELEKLSIIAEKTANAVCIYNSEGEIEWINAGFTKLFGYELSEIKNITDTEANLCINILHKDNLQTIRKTKQSYNIESSCKHKTGQPIWVQTTLTPIINNANEVDKIISVATDITELKLAEEIILHRNEEIEMQRDELLAKNEQINLINESMRSSLRYAKTIQQAILPEFNFIQKDLNCFVVYHPKDIVSGDFYWFNSFACTPKTELILNEQSGKTVFQIESQSIQLLIVSDCTGHGVPGAFMSLIGNRLLNEIINEKRIYTPSKILSELHFQVRKVLKQESSENTDGMDIVICLLAKNETETKVIFAGSKRPLYIYNHSEDKIKKIRGSQLSVGGKYFSTETQFTDHVITCKPNDNVYLTTDGYIDQNNEMRKRFGSAGLEKLLLNIAQLPPAEQKVQLESAFEAYKKNTEQRDDVTIIGVRF